MGNLINCKDCGKEISKKAKTCPHCGAKVKKKKIGLGIVKWNFIIIKKHLIQKPSL